MKKLMMCLLSLSVILSGCVQEEQPEEPPVVEEDEKLPGENNNESNPKDEAGNEEDEQKDELIVDQPNSNESNPKDEFIDETGNNKDNEQSFYPIIQNEYIKFADSQLYNEILRIDSFSVDGGSRYANKMNARETIEVPVLLIDSNDAEDFNQFFKDLYEKCIESYKKVNNDLIEIHFLNVEAYLNEEILSIVVKYDPCSYGVNSYSRYYVYNFSLVTGNRLSSSDLIESLKIDAEKLQQIIDESFSSYDLCANTSNHELTEECIYIGNQDEIENYKTNSINIKENTHLYVKDKNKLELLIHIFGVYRRYEKIELNY